MIHTHNIQNPQEPLSLYQRNGTSKNNVQALQKSACVIMTVINRGLCQIRIRSHKDRGVPSASKQRVRTVLLLACLHCGVNICDS